MRRVAFVTNLCPHYRRPLYELLAERFDVDFFFHSRGEERYLSEHMRSVSGEFREIELTRLRILGQPIMPGLAARLSRRRYDVVVKCLNGRLMVPFVYATARAHRLPFVLWTGMWHHPQTRFHRLTRGATEHVCQRADAVVAYGDHVRRHLVESGVSDDRVYVAGQAVDSERFAGVEPTRNGLATVLYVGQLEPRKGLNDLLSALELLDRVPLRLRLVGSGTLESDLREAASRDSRIELGGYVPQNELPAELAGARCLVLPSVTTARHREPWGLVVNEAMSAGVPVVATTAVGAAAGGLVEDGRNGFVVPERDPHALAAALRSLVVDPQLAARQGANARRSVARFSYDRMADAFEQAVEHAIGARGRC